MPLIQPEPYMHQQENWLFDEDTPWECVGRWPCGNLEQLADPPDHLWEDGFNSTYGRNDRVPYSIASRFKESLRLLRVEHLDLQLEYEIVKRNMAVRGQFRYLDIEYLLRVTDPKYESLCRNSSGSRYPLESCYLTVSWGVNMETTTIS